MSYDVRVGDQTFNYTYNVAPLFYDHIPEIFNRGGIHELNGVTGKEAAAILTNALEGIEVTRHRYWKLGENGDPAFCNKYDAPNGWGSTVGAILFLARILGACAANPEEVVSVF